MPTIAPSPRTRTFDWEVQRAFADLSGDANPMHMDPVAARRTLFGAPVVHGVHTLLWALEVAAELGLLDRPLGQLHVFFRQPVIVGETALCQLTPGEPLVIGVHVGQRLCLEGRISCAESEPADVIVADRSPQPLSCYRLTFSEAAEGRGVEELCFSRSDARRLFPSLVTRLPAAQFATLLAITRVVGMRCPGEHSLLAELQLKFGVTTGSQLEFAVDHADARFSRIVLRVRGGGAEGRVTTFYRPAPVAQPPTKLISELVDPQEFASAKALVVGGSRGLGEVAAKLLAAGGADVCLTYFQGEKDAERVMADIRDAGFRSSAVRLDVLRPREEIAEALRHVGPFTHMIYCPTPKIERSHGAIFSTELFDRFCAYYVAGFARVLDVLLRPGEPLAVLYPSTIFLSEQNADFAEYVSAKAAGETVCALLQKRLKNVRILCPRLPRLRTDQTIALIGPSSDDPLPAMLQALRELWAGAKAVGA